MAPFILFILFMLLDTWEINNEERGFETERRKFIFLKGAGFHVVSNKNF